MKFRTDTTIDGSNILTIYGPDSVGEYAGVVECDGILHGVTWDADGILSEGPLGVADAFDLIDLNCTPGVLHHHLKIK